ncbi:hypothetical protein [Nostoc sp. T09]|uniref:hypothetical protein n=1 Tax=Nostoc sp. T09 TaxID=1932621 RepID=UPI00356B63CA
MAILFSVFTLHYSLITHNSLVQSLGIASSLVIIIISVAIALYIQRSLKPLR